VLLPPGKTRLIFLGSLIRSPPTWPRFSPRFLSEIVQVSSRWREPQIGKRPFSLIASYLFRLLVTFPPPSSSFFSQIKTYVSGIPNSCRFLKPQFPPVPRRSGRSLFFPPWTEPIHSMGFSIQMFLLAHP